eukprot:4029215-Pleurochrysis_carterae.AAC.13
MVGARVARLRLGGVDARWPDERAAEGLEVVEVERLLARHERRVLRPRQCQAVAGEGGCGASGAADTARREEFGVRTPCACAACICRVRTQAGSAAELCGWGHTGDERSLFLRTSMRLVRLCSLSVQKDYVDDSAVTFRAEGVFEIRTRCASVLTALHVDERRARAICDLPIHTHVRHVRVH